MKTKRTFTSQQKTKIALAVITKEITLLEATKKYDVVPSVIQRWKDRVLDEAHKLFEDKAAESDKDKKIKRYEHIITKITTQNDFLERVLEVTK
jgi:transposase-like protein